MSKPFDWNEHRVVVLLALHEAGASYETIAKFVGCSPGTVRSKLHRLKNGVFPRPEKRRLAPRAGYRMAVNAEHNNETTQQRTLETAGG